MLSVQQDHYEALLASFCHRQRAVELLRHHRPYFEKIPSIRRADESVIAIPLPTAKVRQRSGPHSSSHETAYELIAIGCDLAFLMCDPEWQIKTSVEVFVFIHRPGEELSDLLRRWRETQVLLSRGYSWEMPLRYQHIFSEGADKLYPLFVLTPHTGDRIRRGLIGAGLPQATLPMPAFDAEEMEPPRENVAFMEDEDAEIPLENLDFSLESDAE